MTHLADGLLAELLDGLVVEDAAVVHDAVVALLHPRPTRHIQTQTANEYMTRSHSTTQKRMLQHVSKRAAAYK